MMINLMKGFRHLWDADVYEVPWWMDSFCDKVGGSMAWIAIIKVPWSSHIIPIWRCLCIILDVKLLSFAFSYPPSTLEDAPNLDILLHPSFLLLMCVWVPIRWWGTPIMDSNLRLKILNSLIDHGWAFSPLSSLCFYIQINLWTLSFLLGCHNVDIILGSLAYIPYSL